MPLRTSTREAVTALAAARRCAAPGAVAPSPASSSTRPHRRAYPSARHRESHPPGRRPDPAIRPKVPATPNRPRPPDPWHRIRVAQAGACGGVQQGGAVANRAGQACSAAMPARTSPYSGPSGLRALVGLRPNSPQQEAGKRIEPPRSLPWALGTRPAATAAADPPPEPPVVRDRSQGLREGAERRRPRRPPHRLGDQPERGPQGRQRPHPRRHRPHRPRPPRPRPPPPPGRGHRHHLQLHAHRTHPWRVSQEEGPPVPR